MACMSVIVNSNEPSAPVEHVWSERELDAAWECFQAALVIWRNEKGYDPRSVARTGHELPVLVAA